MFDFILSTFLKPNLVALFDHKESACSTSVVLFIFFLWNIKYFLLKKLRRSILESGPQKSTSTVARN